ncbi:MAG TPA: glycosyltransferase family 4 protein, partial [Nannocystaceae bacterium]|nr:glycosyltransferase family 4 protein [Nannocystaceae bacterium]
LACALAEAGHDVHLVCGEAEDERVLVPPRPYRCHLLRIPARGGEIRQAAVFARAWHSLHRQLRFDVLHTHAEEAWLIARMRPWLAPALGHVATVHASWLPPRGFARDLAHGGWRVLDYHLLRDALRHATELVVGSEFVARLVRDALAHGTPPITVVRPAVDACWCEVERARAREPTIVSWGRLVADKVPHTLALAFRELHRRWPTARLVWAGDGPARASLVASLREHDLAEHAELPGNQTPAQLVELAARGWVAAFPTERESFGLSIAEAATAGIPVVASAIGGVVEQIRPDDGVLVPPADPAALARALAEVIDDIDRAEDRARRARDRRRSDGGWRRVAAEMEPVYDAAMRASHRRRS